ncbi:MAG: glycosyltransferase family 4 protein [Alphaproteobacteria bacterium]|nr:glycosyltransferase family 4 protein [Alphaproteobacteria bacterium]
MGIFPPIIAPLIVLLATALSTCGLTWIVLRALKHRQILDHPNERSSHEAPTPRGGGIAVIAVLVVAAMAIGIVAGPAAPSGLWRVLGAAAALACLSWLDDLRSLGALLRLAVQLAAVALGLSALAEHRFVFQGLLPFWGDRVVAGLLWLWFVNLFNFMDGIDGIAGAETVAIGLGLYLLVLVGVLPPPLGLIALAGVGAALGFLWWNWQPARVFLGDVGSVPLGYLLGWLLIAAATAGAWAAALLLPAYYLADATLTLLRRAMRGAAVWRAHREHFYQRAVQGGLSHAQTVRLIVAGNAPLIGLAVIAESEASWRWPALAAGALVVLLVLFLLNGSSARGSARRAPRS